MSRFPMNMYENNLRLKLKMVIEAEQAQQILSLWAERDALKAEINKLRGAMKEFVTAFESQGSAAGHTKVFETMKTESQKTALPHEVLSIKQVFVVVGGEPKDDWSTICVLAVFKDLDEAKDAAEKWMAKKKDRHADVHEFGFSTRIENGPFYGQCSWLWNGHGWEIPK